tara:strand:+ start:70 stop:960 length:891 start_codon:yes stop_codon:yes gene_type:complete
MKIPPFFLAIYVLAIPAHAHHGPFEKESKSRFHEMHLGMAQTLDPNGVSDTYSIKSDGLKSLRFGTESLRPNVGAGPEPLKFEVSTQKIVGYGPGTVSTQSGFSAGNAAAMTATGMFLAAPIFLPLALLTSGQSSTSYAYTVVVMSENGRLQPRQITLWSQKDVGYFNSYLKEATGLEIGEMKTESELNVMRRDLLDRLLLNLEGLKSKLLVQDSTKPWCSKLVLDANDPNSARYQKVFLRANNISVAMGEGALSVGKTKSVDDLYEQYLDSAPHLKTWAEANPAAAAKFKSCPSA